ncbi:uncharacterized protein LAESUDRAFT_333508 [Laetiporus sulphureus 93-53]|uniref:Uncharacterized protein n=1 Tax=Laetiporus sulphureus 93-53 TaxID=1314785 RepID=A0A165CV08_9APHY|nr:uncharacterized protein LAESUDRAFT_333508 [Laetiporus sulphureus 93-53]KZT03477.1 hypothetical protein LAESUDRAFT_333508 [Laetiporus sulphureus 93-53]
MSFRFKCQTTRNYGRAESGCVRGHADLIVSLFFCISLLSCVRTCRAHMQQAKPRRGRYCARPAMRESYCLFGRPRMLYNKLCVFSGYVCSRSG